MRFLIITLLFIFTINKVLADETNFTCKPIYAAVQADNGTFYEESLENMDEEAALLSVVPESKFSIRKNGIFYKIMTIENTNF